MALLLVAVFAVSMLGIPALWWPSRTLRKPIIQQVEPLVVELNGVRVAQPKRVYA